MDLSPEEREVVEEIQNVAEGLYTFRFPDAAEGLRILADIIDQDEHDIDEIGGDVQRLLTDIKQKGEITEEEINDLRKLVNDEKDFQEHLRTTKLLLNKGEVNQAFEIIDNFEKIENALESLENLSSKLERLEQG